MTRVALKLMFLILLLFTIPSCTVEKKKEPNYGEEKLRAMNIVDKFYEHLKTQDYSKAYEMYVPEMANKVDTNTMKMFYKHTENRAGIVKSVPVMDAKIKVVNAQKKELAYEVVCFVQRSQYRSKEKFILTSIGDEEPKIFGYAVEGIDTRK